MQSSQLQQSPPIIGTNFISYRYTSFPIGRRIPFSSSLVAELRDLAEAVKYHDCLLIMEIDTTTMRCHGYLKEVKYYQGSTHVMIKDPQNNKLSAIPYQSISTLVLTTAKFANN